MNVTPRDTGGMEATEHRYPMGTLYRDYLLAGTGMAIALSTLALAQPGRTAAVILGALGVLSMVLGLRTRSRQTSRVALSAASLRRGRLVLPWDGLTDLRLRHFTTRRTEPGGGWMELRLSGPGGRITRFALMDE